MSEKGDDLILREAEKILQRRRRQQQQPNQDQDDPGQVLVDTYLDNVEKLGPERAWSLADYRKRRAMMRGQEHEQE